MQKVTPRALRDQPAASQQQEPATLMEHPGRARPAMPRASHDQRAALPQQEPARMATPPRRPRPTLDTVRGRPATIAGRPPRALRTGGRRAPTSCSPRRRGGAGALRRQPDRCQGTSDTAATDASTKFPPYKTHAILYGTSLRAPHRMISRRTSNPAMRRGKRAAAREGTSYGSGRRTISDRR